MSRVSRAVERLLTTDWLPERALSNKARLLMLLEDGKLLTVPRTLVFFRMVMNKAGSDFTVEQYFFNYQDFFLRNETIWF
jgi:hypothetical protein